MRYTNKKIVVNIVVNVWIIYSVVSKLRYGLEEEQSF